MKQSAYLLLMIFGLGLGHTAIADEEAVELFAPDEQTPEAQPAEEVVQDAVRAAEAAQDAEPAAEAAPDAEPTPEQLQARLRELNAALQAAQTQLLQMNANQPAFPGPGGGPGQGLPLDQIVLAENPTREDCEQYIEELTQTTQGQRGFSSNDPQVEKLKQIPPEHVDLLIGLTASRSQLRYHASYAVRSMDLSGLRDRIDALVRNQPAMIGVVVSRGWALDAREAIVEKFNQEPRDLGIAWFQAASELNDPALFESMHTCALQTRYFTQVITILEGMAGYDIQRTVAELWSRNQTGGSTSSRYQIAVVAARFGHVDALDEMVAQLIQRSQYLNNSGENTYDLYRAALMRHLNVSGTGTEIAQWLTEHKDELVFDEVTQRYLLPEQVERF